MPPRSKRRKVALEEEVLNILFDSDCESEDENFSDVSVSTSDTETDEDEDNDSFWCRDCQKALCIHCFRDYHSNIDF